MMYSVMVMKDGILQTVTQDDLDDFILSMSREDLVTAFHQLFYEVARLRVAAGETTTSLRA